VKLKNPKPDEIRAARLKAELTQEEAAALIGYTLRAWESWEGGQRGMRRALFELFRAKADARGANRLVDIQTGK
jgi:putative transcriptional regulator